MDRLSSEVALLNSFQRKRSRWRYSTVARAWISTEWTAQRHVRQVIIDETPRDQLIEAIVAHLQRASIMYGWKNDTAAGTPREWYAAIARPGSAR